MQLWNWLCKYHFSSDIRNFISHIKYYTQMFFSAYAFKGQVHVFSGQVKIVSHMSCRTSAILSYFCLGWFLCIVVHTVFIPAQNLRNYHECESGRKKSVPVSQFILPPGQLAPRGASQPRLAWPPGGKPSQDILPPTLVIFTPGGQAVQAGLSCPPPNKSKNIYMLFCYFSVSF